MSKKIKTEDFDRVFDEGTEDIVEYLDLAAARRPGRDEARRININMPQWLIDALDQEARHLAVNRQAVINMWLAEKAEERLGRHFA